MLPHERVLSRLQGKLTHYSNPVFESKTSHEWEVDGSLGSLRV